MEDAKRIKERMLKERRARRYMEEEAELGSDNEENDDIRKVIN
jgi:hypothetical protein